MDMKKIIKSLVPLCITVMGTFLVVDGQLDDSPGEMLLGFIGVMYAIYLNSKIFK